MVNQFLTELDGVSGLNGVVVLAATSRPDLIDPALLRPGRLDRLLLCDFPGRDARLEILERSVRDCAGFEDQRAFNEDQLGLHAVAKATEGFSGADLRALATDAHMHAVHRAMESETPGDDEGEVVLLLLLWLLLFVVVGRPGRPGTYRQDTTSLCFCFINTTETVLLLVLLLLLLWLLLVILVIFGYFRMGY